MPVAKLPWSDPRVLAGVAAAGAVFGLAVGGAAGLSEPGAASAPGVLRQAFLAPLPELRPRTGPDLGWIFSLPRARPLLASTPRDVECLADAVYYEARGEPAAGQAAVAQVVLNRTRGHGFPKSVCGVVFQRAGAACQFSFACDGSVTARRELGAWRRARQVAARALDGYRMPEVGGATHFHVAGLSPGWSGRLLQIARIGAHVFYGFGRRAPVAAATRMEAADYPLPASMEKGAAASTPSAPPPAAAAPATVALAPTTPA